MKIYLSFEMDSLEQAQQIMKQIQLPPSTMAYGLPVGPRLKDDVPFVDPPFTDAVQMDKQTVEAVKVNTFKTYKDRDPGFVACQKIGKETKEAIFAALPWDVPNIAKRIKRTEDQTKCLLQLLWSRGEITHDGKDFYDNRRPV